MLAKRAYQAWSVPQRGHDVEAVTCPSKRYPQPQVYSALSCGPPAWRARSVRPLTEGGGGLAEQRAASLSGAARRVRARRAARRMPVPISMLRETLMLLQGFALG